MDDDISAAEGGKKVRKVMSSAICQFAPSPGHDGSFLDDDLNGNALIRLLRETDRSRVLSQGFCVWNWYPATKC